MATSRKRLVAGTAAARGGTHQGLLLDGPHRAPFRTLKSSFADEPADPLWAGDAYRAASLCTSCNESGHPESSIVAEAEALGLARSRGLPLVLTGSSAEGELGSYPVFGFERVRVIVHRHGPRRAEYEARIPAPLRGS